MYYMKWYGQNYSKIIKKYNCICFHTAPLPYGRGGSPIQNMILKKFKKCSPEPVWPINLV